MNLPQINLFDVDFAHTTSSTHGKTPKLFEYVRNQNFWDGITLFTNDLIVHPDVDKITTKYKIAWLLEPRFLKKELYDYIPNIENKFDYILTYDQELLNRKPLKYKQIPFGGSWIEEKNIKIHKKTKLVSMIYSDKNFAPGHTLRHEIAKKFGDKIDLFGSGTGTRLEKKDDAIIDYQYTIVVENVQQDNFFTEKLIDAFTTGTIPIYWGCTNITDFFNESGIIQFDDLHYLEELLKYHITNETFDYKHKLPFIKQNFVLGKEYEIADDWIFKNVLKEILEK